MICRCSPGGEFCLLCGLWRGFEETPLLFEQRLQMAIMRATPVERAAFPDGMQLPRMLFARFAAWGVCALHS